MPQRDKSIDDPQPTLEGEPQPGSLERLAKSRPSRRRVVKGVVAAGGAVAAAGYLKPNMRSLGVAVALAGTSTPPPPPPPPPPGPAAQQGCSPGFYKSSNPNGGPSASPTGGVVPNSIRNQSFFTVFGLTPGTCGLPSSLTLQGALDENPGGPAKSLAFQAAAAFYNSVRNINYPMTSAQVVAFVNNAYTSNGGCNTTAMTNAGATLDTNNNLEGAAC